LGSIRRKLLPCLTMLSGRIGPPVDGTFLSVASLSF